MGGEKGLCSNQVYQLCAEFQLYLVAKYTCPPNKQNEPPLSFIAQPNDKQHDLQANTTRVQYPTMTLIDSRKVIDPANRECERRPASHP